VHLFTFTFTLTRPAAEAHESGLILISKPCDRATSVSLAACRSTTRTGSSTHPASYK